MPTLITRRTVLQSAAATTLLPVTTALAEGHATIVEMLNKHPEDSKLRMVFYPRVLQVNAGDTVLFQSVDRGHNSESIDDMLPEGAEEWKSRVSKDVEITLTTPGFYGYKCTPHTTMGMVGLIVVEGEGKLTNLETARGVKHRGRAQDAFDEIWAEADEAGYLAESTA